MVKVKVDVLPAVKVNNSAYMPEVRWYVRVRRTFLGFTLAGSALGPYTRAEAEACQTNIRQAVATGAEVIL